jgi:hypothetical protein
LFQTFLSNKYEEHLIIYIYLKGHTIKMKNSKYHNAGTIPNPIMKLQKEAKYP